MSPLIHRLHNGTPAAAASDPNDGAVATIDTPVAAPPVSPVAFTPAPAVVAPPPPASAALRASYGG